MDVIRLTLHLVLLTGAINTGVLVSGNKALLFDCGDLVSPVQLEALGIERVEKILFTQHRRVNVSGVYSFIDGRPAPVGPEIIVPAAERPLFEDAENYWREWKNRWHIYNFQPGPEVLTRNVPASRAVGEGDVVEWEGFGIRVIDTPGATDGSVSYLVAVDGKTFCFSGDALYAPGKIWDMYSLQKRYRYGGGDYHGFLGNSFALKNSLTKLAASGADILIPSHGNPIENPAEAAQKTIGNLEKAWKNYTSISSLRYYFPKMLAEGEDDPSRMAFAPTIEELPFIKRIKGTTSFLLKSETGAAILVDCGYDRAVDAVREMITKGELKGVEGIWVTHYHDDHVDGLGRAYAAFGCPVMTDEHMAEILEHPSRFILPCITHGRINVGKKTKEGESWQWHEFTLTAFHFPGQTYYHSGLFVEGHGKKIFLGGDSFSPAGIDDYCAGNRNFLGENRGFNLCIDLLRRLKPDAVFNPHQDPGVAFDDRHYDYMKKVLIERETLFSEMMPWENPNFGLDPWWVRAYPYEQDVMAGERCVAAVQFTNHGSLSARARIEPVLPEGWIWDGNDFSVGAIPPSEDGAIRATFRVPFDARTGQYIVPFRITWNDRFLGPIRHAVVNVVR